MMILRAAPFFLAILAATMARPTSAHAQGGNDSAFGQALSKTGGRMSGPFGLKPVTNGAEGLTCNAANRGAMFYSDTDNGARMCNATSWGPMGGGGAASTLTSTGANTITLASDVVALTITEKSGQTANLQEWRAFGGSVLAYINAAGAASFQSGAYAGTVTAGLFSGPLTGNVTGNASTATALAANGSNCAAGSFPLGVDASGAAESCALVNTGLLTGYTSGAGTVASTDTILQSIQKLNGNIAAIPAGANTALSNLSGVAVNAAISPGSDNAVPLGTSSLRWTDVETVLATITSNTIGTGITSGVLAQNTTAALTGSRLQNGPMIASMGNTWNVDSSSNNVIGAGFQTLAVTESGAASFGTGWRMRLYGENSAAATGSALFPVADFGEVPGTVGLQIQGLSTAGAGASRGSLILGTLLADLGVTGGVSKVSVDLGPDRIRFTGHAFSAGSAPTTTLTSTTLNDGAGSGASITVASGSTDMAGQITITAGSGVPTAGICGQVVFNSQYQTAGSSPLAPKFCVLQPLDTGGWARGLFLTTTSTTFQISADVAFVSGTSHSYAYYCLG